MLAKPHVFERGDKVYLTTPLTLVRPSESEIAEYAFASAVKTKAPNQNIGWVQGRYVEAGRANLNNAMWLSRELAVKALTPMLMPVTVMHDPRTAVGTIADCKLVTGGAETAGTASARIETILAVWAHRFPEVWDEVTHNIENAEMMQSMECYAPWYCCSECDQQYVKLAKGAEQASWCDHLRNQTGARILGDVCFTGTGLIFGSRGAKGAYTEAHLEPFENEIAEYHDRAHVDGSYRPSERSTPHMGLVQIEESELATLRAERNEARTKADELAEKVRDLTSKVETAETAQKAAEEKAATLETEKKGLEEKAQRATLKDKRLGALGDGFMAKLGDFTRERLSEAAGTQSDEEWEATLKEKEEMADVKRDAKKEGGTETAKGTDAPSPSFGSEEVASFMRTGATLPATASVGADGTSAVSKLARAFKPPVPAAATSTSQGDK